MGGLWSGISSETRENLSNSVRLAQPKEGQHTKQIADSLKLSAKTVEYPRAKLMAILDVHDIPALVRFALCVGLIPPES